MAEPIPGPYVKVQDGQGHFDISSHYAPDAITEARYHWLASIKSQEPGTVIHKDRKPYTIQPGQEEATADLFAASFELYTYAEASKGLIAWAKDHGADFAFIESLDAMRRAAIRKAHGRQIKGGK